MSVKRIAILGGTGTVGKAIIDTLSKADGAFHVLIFSRDEIKQLEMMNEYSSLSNVQLDFKLGDVRDLDRLMEVLLGYEFVIHAAAIKHVVMAEMNPQECWKTNVEGTINVVNACKAHQVKKAILISTDKAENPVGVYGRSKKEAEEVFRKGGGTTQFGVIRLGNIVGSRGSVFEIFKKQRETGILHVAHPDTTRFYISKKNAAQFILENIELFDNGQVMIPAMKSFRIMDLARYLGPHCEIKITGLRAGDKLHEELNGVDSSERLVESVDELFDN